MIVSDRTPIIGLQSQEHHVDPCELFYRVILSEASVQTLQRIKNRILQNRSIPFEKDGILSLQRQ